MSLAFVPACASLTQADDPPIPPFRIAGNLYYVGSQGHGIYLLATKAGLILINSNYPDSAPMIRRNVEQLGFKWTDVKILLISHAHIDHCGGSAAVLKETGAKYEVMQGDADVVESGGKNDYNYGDNPSEQYPPTHVDRVLHDGDRVALGGTVLTAHLTPGHTKGDTTWTFDENESGRRLHVVIIGSAALNRNMKLVDNPRYPQIVQDYEKGFAVLRSLPCNIELASHGAYFGLMEKYKRLQAGDINAFIDPAGYKSYVDEAQKKFEAELNRQKAESKASVSAGL